MLPYLAQINVSQFIDAHFCATCGFVEKGHASEIIRISLYIFKPHCSPAERNITHVIVTDMNIYFQVLSYGAQCKARLHLIYPLLSLVLWCQMMTDLPVFDIEI